MQSYTYLWRSHCRWLQSAIDAARAVKTIINSIIPGLNGPPAPASKSFECPLDIRERDPYTRQVQLQARVKTKLQDSLEPSVLEVINESSMHNVPVGSETHLKVVVVSSVFAGKSAVERHRLVYEALSEELRDGLHALSVTSRSPEEWQASNTVGNSPPCLGGSKR